MVLIGGIIGIKILYFFYGLFISGTTLTYSMNINAYTVVYILVNEK